VAYYRGKRYQDALVTFKNMPIPADEIDGWIAACYQRLGDHDRASKHLDLYLEIARKNMARFPETLEEWQEFWKASPSFRPGKGVDYPFDALCDAGLRQFVEASSKNEVPSIAVLPFENMSGDPEQEYFSDGITTSIIMGLGLFTGITVKSQQTSFAFRDSPKSSEEIAEELKVDYLVEGGIRKSGDKIRVSVQLIETGSGNQIWGKQYKAELEDILELEQELSQSITGTISGRIGHKIQQSAVRKPAKNLKSYDLLLRGLYHYGKFTAGDMLTAKELMQKCIDIDPENAEAHMHLGMIHFIERLENWASDRLQSRKQSVYHCEKAIELEPDNALVQSYMAEHLISLREYERAEFHADKAIELNPNASEGYTEKAAVMGFTRRYEEAIALADHCLQLDPHSVGAGWCAGQVYRANGQYDKAIKTFRSIPNAPASIHAQIAASLAGLGRVDQAKKEMKQYQILAREQMLRYPDSREDWHLYWSEYELFQNSEDFETYFDQLLKAGLCDYLEETTDSVPSIAVLPFENMSGDPEQDYFSEGITSDIIATLSRFRGMHVIARHSTLVYKERKASLEEIAAEQQVRYILEGSIRKSGNRIRVIAELIDSHSGENCWSESYDRELDDIFAVQDEITFNITVAMKVHLNAGDRARGNASGTKSVKAWELCTQASDFEDSYIRDNINKARGLIRSALEIDPNYSFAWTTLGWLHWQEVYLAWTDSIDATLDKAENAAQKALELEPGSADAWILTGTILQARGKAQEGITACQKAVSIAPGNSEAQALTGFSFVYAGEPEKALPYYQASLRLAPNCPNWYLLLGGGIYQSKGELPKAIKIYQQAVDVEPESPLARVFLMDTLIDAGYIRKAKKIAGEIRALDDAFKVSGIIRLNSHDPIQRDRFQANMAKMGFND
jgi:TolB-like protein/Tfp pilus assembly protein PilF